MIIYVLLYEIGTSEEGIHSIEINGNTIVLMFEDKDDAERYCGLLEAQDFPKPSLQEIDKKEVDVDVFCVLGMRYHACVWASLQGIPFLDNSFLTFKDSW